MKLLGSLLMLCGVVLGLYMGVYVCFIGGIVSIVDGVQATPMDGLTIGWGFVKIFAATLVGWVSASILLLPGWILFNK